MNHYQVLEVDPRAPMDEIQQAYHRLARRWHPDANPRPDAGRVMAAVNEAWAVLGHPDHRRLYDRQIGIDPRVSLPWEDAPMAPDTRPTTAYGALVTLPVLLFGASLVCFVFGGLMAWRVVLAVGLGFAVLGGLGFIAAFLLAAGRPTWPTLRTPRDG